MERIDPGVIAELEEIRTTGACNMMDAACVCEFADLVGYDHVHAWCITLSDMPKWSRASAWTSALKLIGKGSS